MSLRPWRGPGDARPDLPLPPDPMPLLRGGRPLKRWRWLGAFGEEAMLCCATAHVGPVPVAWWALWERRAARLTERTVRGRGDAPFDLEVEDDGEPVEVVSPHGREYAWTRKTPVRVRGTATVEGRRVAIHARGLVDESAGYHARRTAWRWSAGVGASGSGAAVAWNLVDGVHDAAVSSERTVWIDGAAREVPPVWFEDDLSGLAIAGGGELRFTAEARRSRRERLVVMSSEYEQPFGTFAGELPHAGPLRAGWGVMERHAVRW
jgi:hypothetical protein